MANLRELIKTNQNTWSSRYISNREKERLSSQATETRSPMASHRLTMLKQIHIIRQGSYVIELQKFRMFTSEGKVDLKIPAIFDLKTLSCIMINKSIRPPTPRVRMTLVGLADRWTPSDQSYGQTLDSLLSCQPTELIVWCLLLLLISLFFSFLYFGVVQSDKVCTSNR